jgi:hypothetical protein
MFAALANLFLFALLLPSIAGPDRTATAAGATVLLAAFSIVPYLAVWAMSAYQRRPAVLLHFRSGTFDYRRYRIGGKGLAHPFRSG